ncbi:receptor protein-tyrosine kinase CEPR2-like [Juglans regia]|uniref:Receptor protein-tyrosine kinase CEPR2-like n=2 Tax=Juglans regia TaxID=51240 RepID=A0A2I4GYF4_JUGRE|nr:receptor protein-tyrosine kinase CEPR2-like [Juglans regia]
MARLLQYSSFSLCFHSIIVVTVLGSIPKLILSSTLYSDIQVLRTLKRSVDPSSISPTSYLTTWDFIVDPCESTGKQFLGIVCSIPLDNTSAPSRIIAIDLDSVGYDGFLSPSIGNLTELTTLSLNRNKFRRTIPESISNLKKLTRLSLADNCLTGTIPTEITLFKNLEYLDISGNLLTGSIPTNITRLRSLAYLSFSSNSFTGTIPDLAGLWQLETLDLSSNQLFGNLPHFPTRLKTLLLNSNILSGHISRVKMLNDLRRLDLSDNRFSGHISKDIVSLPRLVHLNVSMNRFTAIGTRNFSREETQLQVLDAEKNNLHGRLPINLTTIQNLDTINLAHNQLAGPLPREYGKKLENSWRVLYLDHNFLSGNVSQEFIVHAPRIEGSLSKNCLRCPMSTTLCRGGQRSASECIQVQ